jgi:hypothetical protein
MSTIPQIHRGYTLVVLLALSLLLSLWWTPASAQEFIRNDDELFRTAHRAYTNQEWLKAAMYLQAYIQRDPVLMRNDSQHAHQVRVALAHSQDRIDTEIGDLKRLVNRWIAEVNRIQQECRSQCRNVTFTGSSVSGLEVVSSPPNLELPSTGGHQSYPIVCRGGGDMLFTYAAWSNLSSRPQVWILFKKAGRNVGHSWENIRTLSPGHCSWLDRLVGVNEPDRIVLRHPEFRPEEFAISWSNGQVGTIAASGFAADGTQSSSPMSLLPLLPLPTDEGMVAGTDRPSRATAVLVDSLQSSEWVQTFEVYNDGRGNFIATGTGKHSHVSNQFPLYRTFNESLNVRSGPGTNSAIVGQIPHPGQGIEITGSGVAVTDSLWVPVRYQLLTGWVNSYYLMEQGNLPEYDLAYVRPLFVKSPVLRGIDVRVVQRRLSELDYTVGSIDGVYGKQTELAVVNFQRDNGLQVDGVAGPQTFQKLFSR